MKTKKNHVLLTLFLCLLALTSCGKNSTTESNAVNSSGTNMSGATVAEESQPEPTFKLVNETVTFECGSNPSTDIHDYLIADDYSYIHIKESKNEVGDRYSIPYDDLDKAFDICMERANIVPSTQIITFADKNTKYELSFTVVSQDTIAPSATVDHYEMNLYLKKFNHQYEQPDLLELNSYYIVEDKEDYELDLLTNFISIQLVNEMTSGAENIFHVLCEDATRCSAIWEKSGDADDIHSSHTSFDLKFLTPDLAPGTYENNIIITDAGNNSISIPIKFCILDDVDPQEREEILAAGEEIREN